MCVFETDHTTQWTFSILREFPKLPLATHTYYAVSSLCCVVHLWRRSQQSTCSFSNAFGAHLLKMYSICCIDIFLLCVCANLRSVLSAFFFYFFLACHFNVQSCIATVGWCSNCISQVKFNIFDTSVFIFTSKTSCLWCESWIHCYIGIASFTVSAFLLCCNLKQPNVSLQHELASLEHFCLQ